MPSVGKIRQLTRYVTAAGEETKIERAQERLRALQDRIGRFVELNKVEQEIEAAQLRLNELANLIVHREKEASGILGQAHQLAKEHRARVLKENEAVEEAHKKTEQQIQNRIHDVQKMEMAAEKRDQESEQRSQELDEVDAKLHTREEQIDKAQVAVQLEKGRLEVEQRRIQDWKQRLIEEEDALARKLKELKIQEQHVGVVAEQQHKDDVFLRNRKEELKGIELELKDRKRQAEVTDAGLQRFRLALQAEQKKLQDKEAKLGERAEAVQKKGLAMDQLNREMSQRERRALALEARVKKQADHVEKARAEARALFLKCEEMKRKMENARRQQL